MSNPTDKIDGYVLKPNEASADLPPALVPSGSSGGPRIDNLDGFKNELTSIGDPSRDKVYGGGLNAIQFVVRLLSGVECEDRWRGSDLGARIVETVPNEMVREGWDLNIQPKDDRLDAAAPPQKIARPTPQFEDEEGAAQAEALLKQLRDLGASQVMLEALSYERAFGGAGVLLGIDDGTDPNDPNGLLKPLNEGNIKRLSHLTALRGGWDGELIAASYYADPRKARYGDPEIYQLRNLGVPVASGPMPGISAQIKAGNVPLSTYVHESRLLIFPGTAVSRRARVQMRGWGDSVFTRVDEVLSQYGQTWGGIAHLMTDWAQGVLKMDGLAALLASNDPGSEGIVGKRMIAIQMSRSLANTMLIDKDEEFKREVTPLSGVGEVIQQFAYRLAAAADMPVTLLMGQAPAGLNATGASDIRFFYDRVAAKQRERLVPPLQRLLRLLMLVKGSPTKGAEPFKWDVVPRPLWQMTELEKADVRNKQAQTDQIYIVQQVVTPEEIAASRFGGSKYSSETTLDFEARTEMARVLNSPDASDEEIQSGLLPTDTPEEGAQAEGTGAKTPGTVSLTPSAQGAIIKVNEARASLGFPPLTTSSGSADPDGELTIAEFTEKRGSTVAAAAQAEKGTDPNAPPPPAPVIAIPPGAGGAKPPGLSPPKPGIATPEAKPTPPATKSEEVTQPGKKAPKAPPKK